MAFGAHKNRYHSTLKTSPLICIRESYHPPLFPISPAAGRGEPTSFYSFRIQWVGDDVSDATGRGGVMGDHIALSCAATEKPLDRFHGGLTISDRDATNEISVEGREDAGGRE